MGGAAFRASAEAGLLAPRPVSLPAAIAVDLVHHDRDGLSSAGAPTYGIERIRAHYKAPTVRTWTRHRGVAHTGSVDVAVVERGLDRWEAIGPGSVAWKINREVVVLLGWA